MFQKLLRLSLCSELLFLFKFIIIIIIIIIIIVILNNIIIVKNYCSLRLLH
jgi:hypothetical protein